MYLVRMFQFDKMLFAHKMLAWCRKGFPELGDSGGMGRGMTTVKVLEHPDYQTDPHQVGGQILNQLLIGDLIQSSNQMNMSIK
jgi:hypothetical protein